MCDVQGRARLFGKSEIEGATKLHPKNTPKHPIGGDDLNPTRHATRGRAGSWAAVAVMRDRGGRVSVF
jgi:hypothetical protein